jgi:predicted RNase H-like HicB family nuclease
MRKGRRLMAERLPGEAKGCKFKPMTIPVIIEKDPSTKRYSAVVPGLPGCASAGDTEAEALKNIKEAITLWFEPVESPKTAKA